jgi:hypothetical protein
MVGRADQVFDKYIPIAGTINLNHDNRPSNLKPVEKPAHFGSVVDKIS